MDKLSLEILLVEDNLTDVLLLRDALDQVPTITFVLTHVERLDAGLKRLDERTFDAVLLDLGLPDSQGLATLNKMQSLHPDVPIMVLSGLDDENLAVSAVQSGAQDYMVKGKINGTMVALTIRYAIERKRSEQKLRAAEAGYRRLFETAQDGIFLLDANSGQITDANSSLEALLGYTVAEFVGKRLWEIAPFRDRAANKAAFRSLQENGFIRYEDLPLAAKDGRFIPVEFVSNVYTVGDKRVIQCNIRDITEHKQAEKAIPLLPLLTMMSLTVVILFCITDYIQVLLWPNLSGLAANLAERFPDMLTVSGIFYVILRKQERLFRQSLSAITERKQAEALLMESQQRLTLATESAHIGIWDWDVPGNKMVWDAQMFALYGIRTNDFSGAYGAWEKGLHPEDRDRAEADLTVALAGDRDFHTQFRVVRPDNEVRHIEAHALVQRAQDGSPLRMTGVNWDITERKQAEESLRRSEERYRSLALTTTEIVWVTDANGMVEDMPAWRAYTGQSIDEVRDANWTNALHPDDREPTLKIWARSVETSSVYETEYRIRAANGEYRLFAVRGVPVLETDGSVREWVGTCADIQDIRKAEEERDRFFTLSLDMLVIIGSDGYMKRLNPAFEATLGFSPAEMMAVPFMEFVHPDDRIATQAESAKLASGALVIQFENRYRCRDGSYKWLRWMCAPHEELWYCVAHDITGVMEIAVDLQKANDELEVRVEARTAELAQINSALLGQIAERERAESEMRARARQQEAVAELGRRALADVDMDTLLHGATSLVTTTLDIEISTILELMPDDETMRFRAVSGWKTDTVGHLVPNYRETQAGYALLNRTLTVVTDLSTETRFKPSQMLLEQGIVSSITIIMGSDEKPFGTLGAHTTRPRRFNQNEIHFLQAVSNVLAAALERNRTETEIRQLNAQLNDTNQKLIDENIERQVALGTLREVSAGLKQAKEEADAANRAKSEFLSRMSHELRTPLNAILGFGQILDKQDLGPLSKESVGYILKGGRHLLDLINEVLDIARVESGHLDLSLEPIALDEIVVEACAMMWPLATERSIRLEENTRQFGPQNILYAMADRQRLKQVLINLLSNAIKYNHDGGQVRVDCAQRPDGWITIAVRDTGPGIAPQDLPKLFVPFERLTASDSEVEGTGLGLVLSQRLMTAMGGTLEVESAPGQGTTFTIVLPAAVSPEVVIAAASEVPSRFDARKEAEHTFTVLCVEDNLSNLRLMEVLLQGRPEITLLVAMQGSIGLDMARQHEPDLILLDLNLSDMHGKDVLASLQQSALTRDIPVVVISADATPNQVERLLAAGAKAYLTKPLDVGQFLHTLDTFLKPETQLAKAEGTA